MRAGHYKRDSKYKTALLLLILSCAQLLRRRRSLHHIVLQNRLVRKKTRVLEK